MRTVRLVSAGGVIFDAAGRVALTARRSFRGERQWGLPKGLVEPGEDPLAAAVREAREETGLEVEVAGPLPVIDYWFVQPAREGEPAARVHKFVHFFRMRATGGDPSTHDAETEEVLFLEPDEALSVASFDSERRIIRAALDPEPGSRDGR